MGDKVGESRGSEGGMLSIIEEREEVPMMALGYCKELDQLKGKKGVLARM